MKIYVITKGAYSEYHICGLTDDPVSAENLRKFHSDRWDEAEIEEYDTETLQEEPKPYWEVQIMENGEVVQVDKYYTGRPYLINEVNRTNCSTLIGVPFWKYTVHVAAKDEEHALKIAQDKIAEYKYKLSEERC